MIRQLKVEFSNSNSNTAKVPKSINNKFKKVDSFLQVKQMTFRDPLKRFAFKDKRFAFTVSVRDLFY